MNYGNKTVSRSRPRKCTLCFTRVGTYQTLQGKYMVGCPSCGNHTQHALGKRREAVRAWNAGQNMVH